MCSYKLVTVKFEVWGLQTRVEQFVHKVFPSSSHVLITLTSPCLQVMPPPLIVPQHHISLPEDPFSPSSQLHLLLIQKHEQQCTVH